MVKSENDELVKLKLFYNESVRQYQLEMDAYDTLTSKANSLLTTISTILILLTITIIQIIINNNLLNHINFLFLISLPYFPLIISLFFSMESYKVSMLQTVNPLKFAEKYYFKDEITILKQLISNISDNITKNKAISKKRMKHINNSLNFLKIAIITLISVTIIFIRF
jgi:hypothetical protein